MSPDKKPEFNFNVEAPDLADHLLAAKIRYGDCNARLLNVTWFLGEENQKGPYRIILGKGPGLLIGVKVHNSVLPLVTSVNDGCIKLDEMVVTREDGSKYTLKGPGKIGKELKLEKGDIREIEVLDPKEKVLRIPES